MKKGRYWICREGTVVDCTDHLHFAARTADQMNVAFGCDPAEPLYAVWDSVQRSWFRVGLEIAPPRGK